MIEVVSGILIQNKKCLIARRNYGSAKGMFEFPGGKVEANESKEDALKGNGKKNWGLNLIQFLILHPVKIIRIMPFLWIFTYVHQKKFLSIPMCMTN